MPFQPEVLQMTAKERMEHYRRERKLYEEQELQRCFEEREEQEASTPCTTDDAVPPEPAPAIAIEAPPAPQGEALVAEVASLKEKIKLLKQRLYKEEGHRLEAQDKLTSVQESAEQEIAEAQRQVTLRQEQCAAALTASALRASALRAKVKELQGTITTLKQTADLSAQGRKKRVFKYTRSKNGHQVMVRPNEPTLVRCKKCGDIFTESFMRRHFVISKGGCQSTKTRGTKSAM